MQVSPSFLRQHLTALLPEVWRLLAKQPVAETLQAYARQARVGSRERRALQEYVYRFIRYQPLFVQGDERVVDDAPVIVERLLDEDSAAWQQRDSAAEVRAHQGYAPEWLAQAIEKSRDFGVVSNSAEPNEDAYAWAPALLGTAALDVRVNHTQMKRDKAVQELQKQGIDCAATPYAPHGIRLQGKVALNALALYQQGVIEVQDEGSQLLALLTGAKRNTLGVDFCAGAGGKTLALLAMMRVHKQQKQQNTSKLYALDTSARRLDALQPRLERAQIPASALYTQVLDSVQDGRLTKLTGKADFVLVDAPCSGTGTLRRQPELKWKLSAEQVQDYARQQLEILQAASKLLRSGGRLVYATCSLLAEENEAVMQSFDTLDLGFEPELCGDVLRKAKVAHADTLCSPDGRTMRLWSDLHGTDGFFAACWRKV